MGGFAIMYHHVCYNLKCRNTLIGCSAENNCQSLLSLTVHFCAVEGDAVTADQLEVLLRKQQHSAHKRAHGGTSKDSSENSPSKLGGIPEAAHDRDSLGSHSVSTQEGSRSQGGQNMKISEHDDVMSTHEDAENVARHTRSRPRKCKKCNCKK